MNRASELTRVPTRLHVLSDASLFLMFFHCENTHGGGKRVSGNLASLTLCCRRPAGVWSVGEAPQAKLKGVCSLVAALFANLTRYLARAVWVLQSPRCDAVAPGRDRPLSKVVVRWQTIESCCCFFFIYIYSLCG